MFQEKDGWSPLYTKKMLFKIAMVLVIVGALNWLLIGGFGVNAVNWVFGKGLISDLIYILVGLSAIFIMCDRDTYLPFLGPMVLPCSVLQDKTPPGATKEVKIIVKPNTKVLYWAAEPANDTLKNVKSWKEAYQRYDNAGVATANQEGVVILKVRPPQGYMVPIRGELGAHIHYRLCNEDGWMTRIHTIAINKNKVDGFEPKNGKIVTNFNYDDTAASIY